MEKEEIKKILDKHIRMLSKISDNELLMIDNPVLLQVVNDGLKTMSFTLLFIDKV